MKSIVLCLDVAHALLPGCGSDDDARETQADGSRAGEGSGVVFRPRRVVTNNHVIESGRETQVALADGRRLDGKVEHAYLGAWLTIVRDGRRRQVTVVAGRRPSA